jgi:hypothetical protein
LLKMQSYNSGLAHIEPTAATKRRPTGREQPAVAVHQREYFRHRQRPATHSRGESITRLNVQPLNNVNFSSSVGTAVPRDVRLQPLPSGVVEVVPKYRGYSFFVVRGGMNPGILDLIPDFGFRVGHGFRPVAASAAARGVHVAQRTPARQMADR